MNFYYQGLNPEVGEALAEVKAENVGKLPICMPDEDHASETAIPNRLVALVGSMLRLHKNLAAAKSAAQKTVIQRQIKATDAKIDRLVYDLYGLTAKEIALVEEANA